MVSTTFSQENERRQERPSPEQMMKEMDANGDGRLAKSEVKGPLLTDFNKIDTNNDDYLQLAELKKIPKPNRQRP